MNGSPLHVAAAAVFDPAGRVLIARRPPQVHQGDLWEFPGGKLEPGEEVREALARELFEELGIRPTTLRPLIRVRHRYPEREVLLDVWRVDGFAGEAHGREGQPLRWVKPDALEGFEFPAANLPIVSAVRLPDRYLITGEPASEPAAFLARLERALGAGVRLVQLRAKALPAEAYAVLAREALVRCRAHGAHLLLNAEPALAQRLGADGVHLDSVRLAACRERPLGPEFRVAASCHDAAQLAHAAAIGADFAVLSPVRPTASHPDTVALGWDAFQSLTDTAALPVYALGGVGPDDLATAFTHGGQGVAAIRALWGG